MSKINDDEGNNESEEDNAEDEALKNRRKKPMKDQILMFL